METIVFFGKCNFLNGNLVKRNVKRFPYEMRRKGLSDIFGIFEPNIDIWLPRDTRPDFGFLPKITKFLEKIFGNGN